MSDSNLQPIQNSTPELNLQNTLTNKKVQQANSHTYISVIRKELIIGEKVISAFMDANNNYYLNFTQVEKLLDLYNNAFFLYLAQAGHLSLPINQRGNAGFKSQRELVSLWSKGLISAIKVHYVQTETGAKYRAAELDLVTDFILDQAYKDNQLARTLNKALTKESLQIRCESAFVGVSPNITEIIELTNHWLSSRQMNQSVHGAFAQFCKETKIPGCHVHDRMTKLVFGQTARMAITKNQQTGEDPDIGLDYQDSPEGQLMIAKMKVKFMSYRKGTWQERVDRCFEDLTETN
jgi:hypothetical protein